MGSTMGRRLLIMTRAIDEARLIVTFGSGSGPGARRGLPAPPGTHPSDRPAQGGKPDDHALDTQRTSADHWVEIAAFLEERYGVSLVAVTLAGAAAAYRCPDLRLEGLARVEFGQSGVPGRVACSLLPIRNCRVQHCYHSHN